MKKNFGRKLTFNMIHEMTKHEDKKFDCNFVYQKFIMNFHSSFV